MKTDNELIAEKRHYHRVHQWLSRNYGKAAKCENPDCDGISKRFEWALRKGSEYSKSIENFIQFCVPCHRKYDLGGHKPWNSGLKTGPQKQEAISKRSNAMKGHKISDETKAKISKAHVGKKLTEEHRIKLSKAKIKHGKYLHEKSGQIHYYGE